MTEKENMSRLTKRLQEGKALCIEECEKECTEGYYECHKCKPFADVLKKLAEYEDIGTVEEFNALKEKNEPKKPNKQGYKLLVDSGWEFACPTCKSAVGINKNSTDYTQEDEYCPTCGQKLDWSE